jgi:hypothetical protein
MMHNHSKVVLAVLCAALLLSAAVGTASANRLEITNAERGFRVVWPPEERLQFEAAGKVIKCPVTIEGTFHRRTFTKTSGLLLGYVTRAIVGAAATCEGGTMAVLPETIPWHVRYENFEGTLPHIVHIGLHVIGAGFRITPTGAITCLILSSTAKPMEFFGQIEEGGGFTAWRSDEAALIPLTGENGMCALAGEGRFARSGRVTVLGGTARVTVRLI